MADTKHKADCKMTFGRKDATCPRCIELINGAPARAGWQQAYFARKARDEAQRSAAIAAHDFKACAARNIVCTCFDW